MSVSMDFRHQALITNILEEHAIAASSGGENEFENLVVIHEVFAKALLERYLERKAIVQAKFVFKVAEIFKEMPPKLDPLKVQHYLSRILNAYEPTICHTAYLTENELEGVDTFFNANQRFYAEWCHITSRAMVKYMKERSFTILLELGSCSRAALATVCKTSKTPLFGLPRKEHLVDRYMKSTLYGPGCSMTDPFSKLLFDLVYSEWLRDSNYSINAVGKDGKQVPGTTFKRNGKKDPAKVIFYWIHGRLKYFPKLEAMCQEWLEEAMRLGDKGDEEFFYAAGAFYHTLMQLSPSWRGSATIALQTIPALFEACKREPPHATFMLDCYALSMQQEDFIRHVFIPLCKGIHEHKDIMKNLHEAFKDRLQDAPKLV